MYYEVDHSRWHGAIEESTYILFVEKLKLLKRVYLCNKWLPRLPFLCTGNGREVFQRHKQNKGLFRLVYAKLMNIIYD